uniref:Acetylglutamate kinase n=1 Tax=Kumanoa americana TaxID=1196377 RepID=A0A1C9CGV5_9FLOR|nr:acetylglutamate kinase [Kumanoa americana]AOM67595.1 acetylglutamate kinase [Kumanoa americana]
MDYLNTVELLTKLLPSLDKLRTSTIVIKYGGAAMKDVKLTQQVVQDIVLLWKLGLRLIIVHGGGPLINFWLDKVNIQTIFENGIRVTDLKTMEVVEMVLAGKVNKQLVSILNNNNVSAIGLSGHDGNLIAASPINKSSNNYVGKIDKINPMILNLLLQNNYLPVVAPIGLNIEGQVYNINADTVAGEIAIATNAQKLIILTDKPGILLKVSDPSSLLSHLNSVKVKQLISDNVITSGMLPKVQCCLKAISQGVSSTHIIDGRISHSLLLSLLTDSPVGSMIEP